MSELDDTAWPAASLAPHLHAEPREPLPPEMSLLTPGQQADVRARRGVPPVLAQAAAETAGGLAKGVPLIGEGDADPFPANLPLPDGVSLLTPHQRAELAARRGGRR
ncbi:MAG TPA: hypothetical protein VHZ31_06810 [Solirubrobacteraceae bacterium]|jgi:hypothetical protein|nr:hypothetical protein [Solirubrobacteraceae bacterium]